MSSISGEPKKCNCLFCDSVERFLLAKGKNETNANTKHPVIEDLPPSHTILCPEIFLLTCNLTGKEGREEHSKEMAWHRHKGGGQVLGVVGSAAESEMGV